MMLNCLGLHTRNRAENTMVLEKPCENCGYRVSFKLGHIPDLSHVGYDKKRLYDYFKNRFDNRFDRVLFYCFCNLQKTPYYIIYKE